MSLDFSAWGENPDIDPSDDDHARSKNINVTIVRKTCVDTWKSVLRFISWHRFSWSWETLGDNVIRTQVSSKTFLLLHVPKYREKVIRSILFSHP